MKWIALLALLFLSTAQADVGISSGGTGGTYYPVAGDIAKTCSTPGNVITNYTSEGSIDNIFKVSGDKRTQYGIAQVDALVYQQGLDKKMMDRIMMVFPFYSEEMHLVVKDSSKINSLADLQGKKVVEGTEGSGVWVTTQVIKATTGIAWQPVLLSQKDGLAAVLNGTADATILVGGKPMKLLSEAQGIKLISMTSPKLDTFKYYTRTMIPSGTYPFQKNSITTYKVDNALITFAFKNQYQKEINDLVTCIVRNVGALQVNGHPKWRDVDPLDIERIQWPAHPAAVAAIKREAKRSTR